MSPFSLRRNASNSLLLLLVELYQSGVKPGLALLLLLLLLLLFELLLDQSGVNPGPALRWVSPDSCQDHVRLLAATQVFNKRS